MQRWFYVSARAKLGLALGVSSLTSIGLYAVGALYNQAAPFWFMPYNLALAWIPFLLSLYLDRLLDRRLWSSWYALLITTLWLLFLPNAFYIVSDLIHVASAGQGDIVYDVVFLTAFVLNGLMLGYGSLYMVHQQLARRLTARATTVCVGLILLLCSFAIYIGRDLRWNSWDVLTSPASLLFDISERFIHIGDHPELYVRTLSFFALLGSTYLVLWYALQLARHPGYAPRRSRSIRRKR